MSTYAAPRRKSDADALQWIARRLQEGTPEEQIVRELRQDGLPTQVAAAMVERVFVSYDDLMRPRGRALERVLASAVLAALGGAIVWIAMARGAASEPLMFSTATSQMMVGAVVGVAVAVAVAFAAGGRRGALVSGVAVAADLVAIVAGHVLADGADAADPVLVALSCACSVGTSVFCLTRWRGRFELVAGESGTIEWRRTKGIVARRP